MPLPGRKRKAPDIISGIPFNERESVNFVTVSKQKRRITVNTTQITVPITPLFRVEESITPSPPVCLEECDSGVYSDTEEAATPTMQNADRKGSSRSVSVSPFLYQYSYLLIPTPDIAGRVVRIPLQRIR